MKKLILTCGIVITIMGPTTAQVSLSDFTTQVSSLHTYITQGNAAGQNSTINAITSLMSKQLSWLLSDFNIKQAAYKSDNNVLSTISQAHAGDARRDSLKKVMAVLTGQMNNEKKQLETERSMNSDVNLYVAAFANRSQSDKTKVLTDLHQFSLTLN